MKNAITILKSVGAILENDHFVGNSGRHMAAYVNKDYLYPHTKETSDIGKLFAEKFKNKAIDVVVGPAVGGIILCQWTAYHLSKLRKKEILAVFTEKLPDENQIFKRGYDTYVKNKKVLVVEDTTTTGGSVRRTVDSVKAAGGMVVAVCVMVNRDPKIVNDKAVGAPFHSLATYKFDSWEPVDCPLCKKGIPVNTKIGHGKKFLQEQRKQ